METITETEAMERFDEFLDEAYPTVKVAYGNYDPSRVLKECDPIAYRVMLADFIDMEAENGSYQVEGYVS